MINKKHTVMLLTLTIVLVGIVSATEVSNDTTNTITQEALTSMTDTNTNVQDMVNTDKEFKKISRNGNDKKTDIKTFSTTATNYDELVMKINDAQKSNYSSYTISLNPGDYNATGNIVLANEKNLIINANNITLDGQNKYQFMEIGEGSSLILNNIILTKYTAYRGGAIDNYGSLTITGSTLYNNTAAFGGAINNWNALTITDSTFKDNTADYGGAISNQNSLTITNVSFIQNTAEEGGAIENYGSLAITNSTLNNNTALEYGGAIRNYDYENQMEINNCNFINNLPFILIEEDSNFNIKLYDDSVSTGDVKIYLDDVYDGDYTIKDNVIKWNKKLTFGEHELALVTNNNNKIVNMIYYSDINESTVNNYKELINEINKFKQTINSVHIINLNKGDYNATGNISLTHRKNLIINANNITLDGQNKYQFMEIAEDSSLTLNSIILTKYVAVKGGAIRNYGVLTVTNSSFNNNTAEDEGGVIWNSNTLTITDSSFNNNTAIFGGAILSQDVLNITNSTFNNNKAYQGGAINNQHILTITNANFTQNTAEDSGGAIYRYMYDYLTGISNCNFLNNLPFELIEEDSIFNIKLYDDIVSSDYTNIYLDGMYDGEYFLSDKIIEWNKKLTNGEHEIIIVAKDNNIITNNVLINISNHQKNPFNKNFSQTLSYKKNVQEKMKSNYEKHLGQVNKRLKQQNNILTLEPGFKVTLFWLNNLFEQNLTNRQLLIYIDDMLLYNSTSKSVSEVLFRILEKYKGEHTLKVVADENIYTKEINVI